jgi:hypothetical protein
MYFIVRSLSANYPGCTDNESPAPPDVIASWPKPNYVDPQTHGPGLLVLTIILGSIGIVIVGMRLYARFLITKAPGLDDVLITFSLVFAIASSVLILIGNQVYYNGYHIWDIPRSSAVGHRINVWTAQFCYTITLSLTKISVLLFYRRLSVSFTKAFMIATWVGIAYNALYLIGFVLLFLLFCRPIQAYWMEFDPKWPQTHSYKCGSEQIAEPMSGILSTVGDLYSALLPMILIGRLLMPTRQKWALYILFSLAFPVIVSGIIRCVYLYRVVNVDYDYTWTLYKIWVTSELEMWIAIYAASAPALKPLFKRYLADHASTRYSPSKHQGRVYLVRSDANGTLGKPERIYSRPRDARHPDLERQTDFDKGMSMAKIGDKISHEDGGDEIRRDRPLLPGKNQTRKWIPAVHRLRVPSGLRIGRKNKM